MAKKDLVQSQVRCLLYRKSNSFFNEPRHDAFELRLPIGPCNGGLALKCRPQDRV